MPVSDDSQPRCFDVMAMDAICGDSKTLDSGPGHDTGVLAVPSRRMVGCDVTSRRRQCSALLGAVTAGLADRFPRGIRCRSVILR